MACGTTPPARYAEAWFTIPDSSDVSSDTDTRCPSPVASRCRSAARIPNAACSPVITSTSATPAFAGRPGSPVTLISPPTACTSRS